MNPTRARSALHRTLSSVEYFTFGFGTMIGVGWLVLMDDWLGRGGPAGGMLAFGIGGLALLPIALTYGRLVRQMPDAGAEVAYTESVFPHGLSFVTGWTMVLAYAIVCPWEAVAIGNLLGRALPELNTMPLYELGGRPIYLPRMLAGLLLTAAIVGINYRGIEPSGVFQNVTTFGLLIVFGLFVALGFWRGDPRNLVPAFAHPGPTGGWTSTLLVLQIVPYFLTGFESVAKGSEEARPGYDPRGFGRAITLALLAGSGFYVLVIAAVAYVYPWQQIVEGGIGTELAFERAFGSRLLAQVIIFGAFLSLLKVFNGNFVAATRLALALGRRGMVWPALAHVHPRFGTPVVAVALIGGVTAVASLLGDALLVPITDVGSLASGIGWFSACAAYLARARRAPDSAPGAAALAWAGLVVSGGIVSMKVVPAIPGSFGPVEWGAFGTWLLIGLVLWTPRRAALTAAARQSGR